MGDLATYMFPALLLLVLLGLPVAFVLLVVAFGFGILTFGGNIGSIAYGQFQEVAQNYVLSAVPLFILMGTVLERSGIAERLFLAMQFWFGRVPGGVALGTISMCAIFAAATGIVGAVEAIVGMMAIPAMRRARYKDDLIAGTICAGGSLGTIIPPSLVVVIYASIAEVPVGDLLAGIIGPGLMMVVLFLLYIFGRALLFPMDAPRDAVTDDATPLAKKLWLTFTAVVPALVLMFLVLGSILFGVASPTEAAGVGAAGALVLSIANGTFNRSMLTDVALRTIYVNSMIMFIVVGGGLLSGVFRVAGGNHLVQNLFGMMDFGAGGAIALMLAVIFVLGFLLDWVSILLICMPIFVPVIKMTGVDPLWFGVMVCVVVQTSYLTPPMAPAVFYLKSIAPPDMTIASMYRGVVPFIVAQLIVLFALAVWPPLGTYLPQIMFRF